MAEFEVTSDAEGDWFSPEKPHAPTVAASTLAVPAPTHTPAASPGEPSSARASNAKTVDRENLARHREAWESHMTMKLDLDERLKEMDIGEEFIENTKKRRECMDICEHLEAQFKRLEMKAKNERQEEIKLQANISWEPLANDRVDIIKKIEACAGEVAELFSHLSETTRQQIAVLEPTRTVTGFDGLSEEVRLSHATQYLKIWFIRACGLTQAYPDISALLPYVVTPWDNESLSMNDYLFPGVKP